VVMIGSAALFRGLASESSNFQDIFELKCFIFRFRFFKGVSGPSLLKAPVKNEVFSDVAPSSEQSRGGGRYVGLAPRLSSRVGVGG